MLDTVYSPWYKGIITDGIRKGKISFRKVDTKYGYTVYQVCGNYVEGYADTYTLSEALRDIKSVRTRNGKLVLASNQGQITSNYWTYSKKDKL